MKRKNLYLKWSLFYTPVVILILVFLSRTLYNDIFFYLVLIFLFKDIIIDFLLNIDTWPKWSEHLPLVLIITLLWPIGFVSYIVGLIALTDSVIDFILDQKIHKKT